MKNQTHHIASTSMSGLKIDFFKKATLACAVLLYSIVGYSQLEISNAQLCAQFTDMPLFAQGDSYIVNNTDQSLQLTLSQSPTGSFLQQGMNYDTGETLNFSQQGEYIFDITDSLGGYYGMWNVASYATTSVSAGSSSSNICISDTVPLVGSLPYDNQGNVFSYYFVEWTQIDDLPAVNWTTASDEQIAHVTNFQTPGTYIFEYTLNPGTDCSTSDVMTVTVEDCTIAGSVTVSNVQLCAQFTDMPLFAQGDSYIVNTTDQTLQLTLSQSPTGSFLQQGMSYATGETLNFSQQGEYIFDITDSLGGYYGMWNVASYATTSVSAGSSSTDICINDTVPLVGSLPYDNQGNVFTYYFVEWTQIDDLPAVNWTTTPDAQIAQVTNFQTPGTYIFEYTLNPGTDCSTSDVMTVTVIDCDVVSSISESTADVYVNLTVLEGQFNVLNNYRDDIQLMIIDLSGRQVMSEQVYMGGNEISTQNLRAAMYVYRIVDNGGQILTSGKVIIQ